MVWMTVHCYAHVNQQASHYRTMSRQHLYIRLCTSTFLDEGIFEQFLARLHERIIQQEQVGTSRSFACVSQGLRVYWSICLHSCNLHWINAEHCQRADFRTDGWICHYGLVLSVRQLV
jgi:hypothetical protein